MRIVREWADEVLYHVEGQRYELRLLASGELLAVITAENDLDAIEKTGPAARAAWDKKKAGGL